WNKADNAQGTANEAWNKADNAQGTANEAWNKADNAQGTANEAWNKADNAQGTANEAWNKADNAQGTANEAWNKADNAQGTANEAWNKADNAQGTANEAWNKADNAQGTANEAWNKADNAQGTANEAWNKADNVQEIVGDGNLTNGGSTLTEGININSTAIAQNRQDINNLNHRVDNLDSRIDKVGAGAAALAALHPLDFDPDAKWDFAAGYGNYNGENAVAVGTFYRPNEDTMFSVGGTFGNGENMINAGVSLKIGAGSSHVTTSRVAMAKEIKSMRDVVAKQDAQIQKLTAMVNALVGVQTETDTTTMFPDVPENHWAYEAVEAMAKSGLVKGYPDGEFKGDRNMTRYEFAQIVYNAIQAGAEVEARLVEEFKPELEYFHIATVAKDKDGNPTIERVRAN
ncbi:alanine-zipper protein, partial [uncultured Megasphaera sp.]|uniref:alanine-zipper protein n=1 Tax=uncultured Megasphaera sp. TaxID=165188 RepID=UPI0026294343